MNLNATGRMKVLLDALFSGRQDDFAKAVGVNKGTISRWITGKTKVNRYTLIKVSDALKGRVNAYWLLNGEGDPGIKSNRQIDPNEYLPYFQLTVLDNAPTLNESPPDEYRKSVTETEDEYIKRKLRVYEEKKQDLRKQIEADKQNLELKISFFKKYFGGTD